MASFYEAAREVYGLLGVDTEAALGILARDLRPLLAGR